VIEITPSGNNETWVIRSTVDPQSCSTVIDFNVPGKPNPPPVNLTATFRHSTSVTGHSKAEFEFSAMGGTMGAKSYPLNHWVEIVE